MALTPLDDGGERSRNSSRSRSPKSKSHQNPEDHDEVQNRVREDEDDLIIIPEERSERFQIDDDYLEKIQGRRRHSSNQPSRSSWSTKSVVAPRPAPRTRRHTIELQTPHSAPTSKRRSAGASSSGRMLLTPLGTNRKLNGSVPAEENDMLDFSDVSELGNSFRSSGRGSWNWIDEPSSNRAEESLKKAKFRVDEAFLEYTIVEKAALKLQQSFRSKRGDRKLLVDILRPPKDAGDTTDDDSSDDPKKESEDDEPADRSSWYTLLFLGFLGSFQTLFTFVMVCCGGNNDGMDVDVVPVDGIVNVVAPPGAGGGGGTPTPGLEAMAGQAAGAAVGSAGAGAAAGVAAGAAAAAAGGAAGAATAGAGVTTQVVTVVAVSSAVATVAATAGILTPSTSTEVILTRCGLANPQTRIGKFGMIFEGFSRTLDGRESDILEGLVLDAYNEITFGADFSVTGNCSDPLSREMEDANVLNQTFVPLIEGGLDGSSYLEIMFETRIMCDNCLASRPLFKNEQEQDLLVEEVTQQNQRKLRGNVRQVEESSQHSTRKQGRLLEETGQEIQDGERFQDTFQDLIEEELAGFDVSGADFFQALIQRIIFGTEELSLIGELPTGFVRVAQAYITPTPRENGVEVDETDGGDTNTGNSGAIGENEGFVDVEEPSDGTGDSGTIGENEGGFDVDETSDGTGDSGATGDGEGSSPATAELFTTVKFQKQGDKVVFEFTFVDEDTQEKVQETVVVNPSDPNLVPVPTTSLPTFAPTTKPTNIPSSNPTINFSGQPTRIPSLSPSLLPTVATSENPSSFPSPSPSNGPSREPTISPSTHPTINFSGQPTRLPSKSPSFAPSNSPTDTPSGLPSKIPSETPSMAPSFAPSMVPSVVPSLIPSMVPSTSPSNALSHSPSLSQSDIPSANPSGQPSGHPSASPSSSQTDLTSALPSRGPTILQSASPSGKPSYTPSASPSVSPSRGLSMLPTGSTSGKPSVTPSSSPSGQLSVSPSKAPIALPSPSPSLSSSFVPTTNLPAAPPGTTYIGQGECSTIQGGPPDSCYKNSGVADAEACHQLCGQFPQGLVGFDIAYTSGRCNCWYDDGQSPPEVLGSTPNVFNKCITNNSGSGPIDTVESTNQSNTYCYAILNVPFLLCDPTLESYPLPPL